jgi:mutator protein MutT
MRQKISVRAVVSDNQKVLLLRRANGRPNILGKFELPGGKLEAGEQPEDALNRYLRDDAGLVVKSAQLFDVLTYTDRDNPDEQYLFILYIVQLGDGAAKIRLSQNYDKYAWKVPASAGSDELTDSTNLLLNISRQHADQTEEVFGRGVEVVPDNDTSHAIIYSDGGSRGNPGPSAAGFVIMRPNGEVIVQDGAYLGVTTNNLAEYQGLLLGLERALAIGVKTIDFRLDSLLVVNQMNGVYKIKNRELWPIHERIKELLPTFDKVTFSHVRRERNQLADGMVNKILNQHTANPVRTLL